MGNACTRKPVIGISAEEEPGVANDELVHVDKKAFVAEDDDGAQRSDSRYVGSFGKLQGFLDKCLEAEVITERYFDQLLVALEDVSGNGRSTANTRLRIASLMSQRIFRGSSEDEVTDAMNLMDISTSTMVGKGEMSMLEDTYVIKSPTQASIDVARWLDDPAFNCRTRGENLQSDVKAITRGFSVPYDLVARYTINAEHLCNWTHAIQRLYNSNPYHNWMHAFDVYQFLHMSLASGGAGEFFNFQDILALFCSAIAHDVGHTGINNAFLTSSNAKLAITYNDRSPLENMHASVFFETLYATGNNFLEVMKSTDFKIFRSKVIEIILATDMTHHFDLVDKFGARVEHRAITPFRNDTKNDREKQKATKEDRRLLMRAFIHMADLGHCTRPWDVHKILVTCLEEEFFSQGDQESAAGLPISPLNDRQKDSAAAGQTFFLDKLVRPLLDPYCTFLAPDIAETLDTNVSQNREKWAELVRLHGKLPAKDLIPLEAEGKK